METGTRETSWLNSNFARAVCMHGAMSTAQGYTTELRSASALINLLKKSKIDNPERPLRKHSSAIRLATIHDAVLRQPDGRDCSSVPLEFQMQNALTYTASEFCDLCSQASSSEAWSAALSGHEQGASWSWSPST